MTLSNPSRIAALFLVLAALGAGNTTSPKTATTAPATPADAQKLPPAASRRVDFIKDVQPILAASCYSCHGEAKQKSGYRLDVKSIALKGGDIGGSILPGNSAASPFIRYVAGLEPDMMMPAKGPPLTAEQVGVLRAWIDQGAPWPESAGIKASDPLDHWAYKPLSKPAVPKVKNQAWVKTPIDAFILARLEEKGLAPSAQADRRTLIRRIYFDLIGLPPTPEQTEAFVADASPDAYEKVVDSLLASPRYGERWARHWMDVVHFAETHGNDQDRIRPNAWPYRDYLIRSFNDDKPYARFIEEQLAGDVLYPDDPQAVVALGFIASGPWDESSNQSIQEDTLDRKIGRNLDRDDMVTTAMSTFVSSTVQCARCHNHKFDPISQQEYYNLQAIFAGVERADRPYDGDPLIRRARQALQARKTELESGAASTAGLLDSGSQAEVAAWEAGHQALASQWTVLDPVTFTSTGGATPVKQNDGSILFTGSTPETDVYTVTANCDAKKITAVRLEVLADDSLPHKGPGRQPDNGNLHVTEFKLLYAPRSNPTAITTATLQNPTADFNQDGWTIAHAIDGKNETAWGIHPQEGKSHSASFEIKDGITNVEGGLLLTFVIEQNHGRKHVIGRPRLSYTTAVPPVRLNGESLPDEVARILPLAPELRTDPQKVTLATFVQKLRVQEQISKLPPPPMVYAATSDYTPEGKFMPGRPPRPVFVLKRGDVASPLDPAMPGALHCVPGVSGDFKLADPNSESQRRAALAKWTSDSKNVLTWRSIVNRVWHYHFSRGIVETPNDFGHMGAQPSHPELLDWLAKSFLENGGSLKKLHRMIVLSAAYQQSARSNAEFAKVDGANTFLWRANRTRLDAECIRDSVLQITGKLDLTMGGPSARHFVDSPGIHVTPLVDYQLFDVDSPASYRRSVYRFVFRTMPDPFMDSMDCADPSQLTPSRNSSVTALQALAMLNNRFIVRQCEHLATRLAQAGPDPIQQIDLLYRLALNRAPTADEAAAVAQYASKHGMANACRVILNSNEFMFVN